MTLRVFPPGMKRARSACRRYDSGFRSAYRRSASASSDARSASVASIRRPSLQGVQQTYDRPVQVQVRTGAERTLELLEAQIGRAVEEAETPAAMVDLDRLEANLRRLQDYADEHGISLWP